MLCKLCEGTINVPEGESVLHVCSACLKRDDLDPEQKAFQYRQKRIAQNPKVKVYKATNVPVKEAVKEPEKAPQEVVEPVKAVKKKAVKKAPKKAKK